MKKTIGNPADYLERRIWDDLHDDGITEDEGFSDITVVVREAEDQIDDGLIAMPLEDDNE